MANEHPHMSEERIVAPVKHWLETVVVGLDLCPFARKALLDSKVHFAVAWSQRRELLLERLAEEIHHLDEHPEIQTTLLIHPRALLNFEKYNQFLDLVDELLERMDKEGVYQVASFHPQYAFEDVDIRDPANYSNRSPYPILHLLREDDVEAAIASHPDIDSVPQKNIRVLREMGEQKLLKLLESCFHGIDKIDESISLFKNDVN